VAERLPRREELFEPLLELAKARTLALLAAGALDREEAWVLARAVFDLESDGVELFGAADGADAAFYEAVSNYVADRVGRAGAAKLGLAAADAAAMEAEAADVARQLRLSDQRLSLDRAVLELVIDHGGSR
jgi:hypothetical protein